jgi:hypothetical protein
MGTRTGGSGRGGKGLTHSQYQIPPEVKAELRALIASGTLDPTALDKQGRYHVFHGTTEGGGYYSDTGEGLTRAEVLHHIRMEGLQPGGGPYGGATVTTNPKIARYFAFDQEENPGFVVEYALPADKILMHIRGHYDWEEMNIGSGPLADGKVHPLWNAIPAKYIVGLTRL